MSKKILATLIIAIAAVAVSATSSGSAVRGTRQVPTLTMVGHTTWEVEALLRDTFGDRQPALDIRASNFSCAGSSCAPLSRYSPYVYLFANAHGSAFHLVTRKPGFAMFGNATPVRIKGRYIACSSSAKEFVVRYANAFGAFTCVKPL
jgi:hypothetical protein